MNYDQELQGFVRMFCKDEELSHVNAIELMTRLQRYYINLSEIWTVPRFDDYIYGRREEYKLTFTDGSLLSDDFLPHRFVPDKTQGLFDLVYRRERNTFYGWCLYKLGRYGSTQMQVQDGDPGFLRITDINLTPVDANELLGELSCLNGLTRKRLLKRIARVILGQILSFERRTDEKLKKARGLMDAINTVGAFLG